MHVQDVHLYHNITLHKFKHYWYKARLRLAILQNFGLEVTLVPASTAWILHNAIEFCNDQFGRGRTGKKLFRDDHPVYTIKHSWLGLICLLRLYLNSTLLQDILHKSLKSKIAAGYKINFVPCTATYTGTRQLTIRNLHRIYFNALLFIDQSFL